jgi:hypothetical protein
MGRHAAITHPVSTPREHPAVVARPRPVHRRVPASLVSVPEAAASPKRTRRRPVVLPMLGFCASFAFVGASLVNPLAGAEAATNGAVAAAVLAPGQSLTVTAVASPSADRDSYGVTVPPPPPPPEPVVDETESSAVVKSTKSKSKSSASAPVAGKPDPGTAKGIAADMISARGLGSGEYDCLVSLWNKESGWNVYANNPSSGAYGIPQSLPGSKMATAGGDWQTNPATQITWGLDYIKRAYGTPCSAWAHSVKRNWY